MKIHMSVDGKRLDKPVEVEPPIEPVKPIKNVKKRKERVEIPESKFSL